MSEKKQSEDVPDIGPYLWDGSGEPDQEIQRLESALARYRHAGALPTFPDALSAAPRKFFGFALELNWLSRAAALAFVLIAVVLSGLWILTRSPALPAAPGWDVVRVDGTPLVGANSITSSANKATLHPGQTLVTNSDSRATISVAGLGEIQVDPDSRLRLLLSSANRKRISLEIGTIHAAIWAPPGQFVVDTPSAVAVDLGCAYTLHVDPDGSGTLRTTLGWVGFHLHGRDSFIPAGAICSTRPGIGPGTPYFEDAPEQFRAALHQFDFASLTPEARSTALETILAEARPRDALTLWHLLSRTDGTDRARVYTRLAALVPPPRGVTRQGILLLDQPMLDLWWNTLGFGDIAIWRYWEQSSAPANRSQSQLLLKKQMLLKQPR